jgi:hypothetical protein
MNGQAESNPIEGAPLSRRSLVAAGGAAALFLARPQHAAADSMFMVPYAELPHAFQRYKEIGGVLDFAAFQSSSGSDEANLQAIGEVLAPVGVVNIERLRSLGSRRIDQPTLLGKWVDSEGMLLKLGSGKTAGGQELENPRLVDLEGVKFKSWGAPLPEPGAGGELAYAFSDSPYGLKTSPQEIQKLFEDVRSYILPKGMTHQIRDWSSPQLPEVSGYFLRGMEWWGVFLFTIHTAELNRLVIICGSASD